MQYLIFYYHIQTETEIYLSTSCEMIIIYQQIVKNKERNFNYDNIF